MLTPFSSEAAVKRARWLLLLPPCLPGLLILGAGWLRGVFWPGHDAASALLVRQQAEQMYLAGNTALAGGVLMAAFVAWKILRPPPPDPEEAVDGEKR